METINYNLKINMFQSLIVFQSWFCEIAAKNIIYDSIYFASHFIPQLYQKRLSFSRLISLLFFFTQHIRIFIHKTLLAIWISISLIKTIIIINGHFLKFTSSADSLFQFQTCYTIDCWTHFIQTTQQNTNTARHLFARMKPYTILQFSYKNPS